MDTTKLTERGYLAKKFPRLADANAKSLHDRGRDTAEDRRQAQQVQAERLAAAHERLSAREKDADWSGTGAEYGHLIPFTLGAEPGSSKPLKQLGTAYLFLILLGLVGGHRFYLGQISTGILYACTGGLFGVGAVIDIFRMGQLVKLANYGQVLSEARR